MTKSFQFSLSSPLPPMTESDKLFWKWSAGTSRLPQAAQMLNVCSRMVGLLPQTTVPAYLARNFTRYSSSARTPWWQTLTLAGCRPDALLYRYFQHWIKKECWLIGIRWTIRVRYYNWQELAGLCISIFLNSNSGKLSHISRTSWNTQFSILN
mgnify:CR=1 FL=1